jgi:glycosyltransferase involved in cell wall biosynthesis
MPPNEVWLVDDCSLDDTNDLALRFIQENKLSNWTIISTMFNSGPAAARHLGIKSSKSKYIALLDSDDIWLQGKLDYSIDCMEANCLDLYGGEVVNSYNISQDIHHIITSVSLFSELISNRFNTSTVVFKRLSYFFVGGFNLNMRYSEDYSLWLMMCSISHFRCCISSRHDAIYTIPLKKSNIRLSNNLFKMEMGEISNYILLYKKRLIGPFFLFGIISFSLMKYFLRIIKSIF